MDMEPASARGGLFCYIGPMFDEAQRQAILDQVPPNYPGRLHFVYLNLLGGGSVVACLMQVRSPVWWEWLTIPLAFLFANAAEWRLHYGPMHHSIPGLREIYQRHAKSHHVVYTHDRMGFTHPRELRWVLFPAWALPIFIALVAPLAYGLGRLATPNVGYIFYATCIGYYVFYEWLHTLYHVPEERWIARRGWVRHLRQLHQQHHNPALMGVGNFNITFPIWDAVRGTRLDENGTTARSRARKA